MTGFDHNERSERDHQLDRDWERHADEAIRHAPAPERPRKRVDPRAQGIPVDDTPWPTIAETMRQERQAHARGERRGIALTLARRLKIRREQAKERQR